MHACGHDFDTAALLTAARILWEMREQFEGTVKLIFQPGEEGVESGALAMLSGGDLDDCDAFMRAPLSPSLGETVINGGLPSCCKELLLLSIVIYPWTVCCR